MARSPLPVICMLLGAAATLSGCPSPYNQAARLDTVESYRAFIRDHPDEAESEAARVRLEELEFSAAQKLHTVLAYRRFLEEFPTSEKAPTARALLEGLRWNATQKEGTAKALRRFLREHPEGVHRGEAETELARMDSETRAHETEPARLREALAKAPEAERADLGQRLDDLTYAAAEGEGAGKLLAYLSEFPAGSHREEAKRSLLSRKLDGLLFSGLLDDANAEAQRSPLGAGMADWKARLDKAQAEEAVAQSPLPAVTASQPAEYVRKPAELIRSLGSMDPLDRWQAAEEMGAVVSVQIIDPLLDVLRASRNARVRYSAFVSLQCLMRTLPPRIAEHELAVRLAPQQAAAGSPELEGQVGLILDLMGRNDEASTEYRRVFDAKLPDPLILWRWMELRLGQHKAFSAAVAARQIGLWTKRVLEDLGQDSEHLSLAGVRQMCAAAFFTRVAYQGLERAVKEEKEFPEDMVSFLRETRETRNLAEARLKDIELTFLTKNPGALGCDDNQTTQRLEQAERRRGDALRQLPVKAPKLAPTLLARAKERDPSPRLRELARELLAHPR